MSPVPPTRDPPPVATILVVDDETPVRALCRRVLTRDAHQVIEARSAEEALALTESGHEPIHLLLTDVMMSGMSGVELAAHIVERMPGVPVLLMSGGLDREHLRDGRAFGQFPVLAKPFAVSALRTTVRALLAGREPIRTVSSQPVTRRGEPPSGWP